MRGGASILIISMLSLTACEKDFDEKYRDNLEELNKEAKDIKSGVDEQLAEGRKADRIMESEAGEAATAGTDSVVDQ